MGAFKRLLLISWFLFVNCRTMTILYLDFNVRLISRMSSYYLFKRNFNIVLIIIYFIYFQLSQFPCKLLKPDSFFNCIKKSLIFHCKYLFHIKLSPALFPCFPCLFLLSNFQSRESKSMIYIFHGTLKDELCFISKENGWKLEHCQLSWWLLQNFQQKRE